MINLHVLCADRDADIPKSVAQALESDPFFVVRGCASGAETLAAATAWRPDLVLLDVAMPSLTGAAVLRRLRAERRTAAIPVVFMSARAATRRHAHLKTLGAAGFIAKPFDPAGLAATLRRFLPLQGALARREDFLSRLHADASALSACRSGLAEAPCESALVRINAIAHALAGAGGIYGYAGITCESAALCDIAEDSLAGRAGRRDVEQALDRLLLRLRPH